MFYERQFLEHLQADGLGYEAMRGYSRLLHFAVGHFRDRGVDEVREVGEAQAEELMRRISSMPLAGETVHLWFCRLRRYFAYLKQQGLIFLSPMERTRPPEYARRHHPALPPEEMPGLLDQIRTDKPVHLRTKAMVELAYSSGLRLGEIARLKVRDIDFSRGRHDV